MSLIWFGQESENSCVAACVRMVLAGLGKTWSESEIIRILGNPRLGITLAKAQAKLSEFGANAELDADLNLDDLRDYTRQNIFPIVGVE
ncbi:MAG: cysteine peptidase family C39 domain-containing protein [Aridibacter sp.]